MEVVARIVRVDAVVELLVGGFDAQQVAVCAGLEPAAVGCLALLAQRQGDAQRAVVDLLDTLDDAGDLVDELGIVALAALDGHGTVAEALGELGARHGVVLADGIAGDLGVAAAYPAVEARLAADVTQLDESAQMHVVVEVQQFDVQSLAQQRLVFVALRVEQPEDVLPLQKRLIKNVLQYHIVTRFSFGGKNSIFHGKGLGRLW